MEFEAVAKSPWVQVKLVGNREYEDYRLGSIDRRSYLSKMAGIARRYASTHLGVENTVGSRITGQWSLAVDPTHGVGFALRLTPLDTPTRRASMEPIDFFFPADYAFMKESERYAFDEIKGATN